MMAARMMATMRRCVAASMMAAEAKDTAADMTGGAADELAAAAPIKTRGNQCSVLTSRVQLVIPN